MRQEFTKGTQRLSRTKQVRDYFDRIAVDFDSIYSRNKGIFRTILDAVFRKTMKQRFSLVFEKSGDVQEKRILDVGCGSGQYCLEFARRDAAEVVGIDLSENMLELAENYADQYGLKSMCRFVCGDFLTYEFGEHFHIAVAIGLFDYIKDPVPILIKLREVSDEYIMASFPIRWDLRSPIRKIRLTLKKCDVYFYNMKRVEELLKRSGFDKYEITKLDRDYFVFIDCR